MTDSDSKIAWHRAQLKKHIETLKDIETSRFTVGEISGSPKRGQTQKIVAELRRKIRQSEQVIVAYEKQSQRPRATDYQSLASVRWSNWNAHGV
jgi:hypothetical protein